ncbi:MAG: translation initiation factor IF-2 associated domain-containing protein, partial [Rhodocyclaceae bacterium]|nr:translation initiation factor IF-2 associated domain-containing protein [Rhodocyclaceae bacterium]
MDEMNVARFAEELKKPVEELLAQFERAGVKKSRAEDAVSAQDKQVLLDFLRQSHGEAKTRGKITLTRRQTSELRAVDVTTGKARTVQVEVRKKRTLVSREVLAAKAAAEAAAAAALRAKQAEEAPASAPAPKPKARTKAPPAPQAGDAVEAAPAPVVAETPAAPEQPATAQGKAADAPAEAS